MRWIGRHAPRLPGHIHQPVHLPAVPVLTRAVVIGRRHVRGPRLGGAQDARHHHMIARPPQHATGQLPVAETITPPPKDLNRINEPAIPALTPATA
jgi:hypothetical protein